MGFFSGTVNFAKDYYENKYEKARGAAGVAGYTFQIAANTTAGAWSPVYLGGLGTAGHVVGYAAGGVAEVLEIPDAGDQDAGSFWRGVEGASHEYGTEKYDDARDVSISAFEETKRDWTNLGDQALYAQIADEEWDLKYGPFALVRRNSPPGTVVAGLTQAQVEIRLAELQAKQDQIASSAGTYERGEGGSPTWWEGKGAVPGFGDVIQIKTRGVGAGARKSLPAKWGKFFYGWTGEDPNDVPMDALRDFEAVWGMPPNDFEPTDAPLSIEDRAFYEDWMLNYPYAGELVHPILLMKDGVTRRDTSQSVSPERLAEYTADMQKLSDEYAAGRAAYNATPEGIAALALQKEKDASQRFQDEIGRYKSSDFDVHYFMNFYRDDLKNAGLVFDSDHHRSLLRGTEPGSEGRKRAEMYASEESMRLLNTLLTGDSSDDRWATAN